VRVGVLGGTFDPVHRGHVALAKAALQCASLDLVLVVPAGEPPHRGQPKASAADRLEMCRLALAGEERIEVSDIELRRPGASYTVDTLRGLQAERPRDELHLILGWDAARDLRSWKERDEVLRRARLVIVDRPGLPGPNLQDLRESGINPRRTLVCRQSTPDIKASDIRRRLARREGEPAADRLEASVAAYIREKHLYGGDMPESPELPSRQLAELLISAAESKQAWDPMIIDLAGKTTMADYMVICDGETDRQLRAIAEEMIDQARERRIKPLSASGLDAGAGWILLDFDSVLAHVFLPGERSYYDLEALWQAGSRHRRQRKTALEDEDNAIV